MRSQVSTLSRPGQGLVSGVRVGVTAWHSVSHRCVATHYTLRLAPGTRERLGQRARRVGVAERTLAQRYLEEGLRHDAHPLIQFLDGTSGRRASLIGRGLDVWEVIATVRDNGGFTEAAAYLQIPVGLVEAAASYYGEHREEIDRGPARSLGRRAVRELRELVRHRHKLVHVASSVKAQVHAALGKNGIAVTVSDLFGVAGSTPLRSLTLPEVFRARVDSQLRVLDALEAEVDRFDKLIRKQPRDNPRYRVIQQVPGVGPVFAVVFVAELGDVARPADAGRVCSWAGLTPRHRESDTTVHRGSITKQGSRLVRWAAVEAVQRSAKGSPMRTSYERIVERRGGTGKNVAKVAAARKLLSLVYYGLRDGEIRCLTPRVA